MHRLPLPRPGRAGAGALIAAGLLSACAAPPPRSLPDAPLDATTRSTLAEGWSSTSAWSTAAQPAPSATSPAAALDDAAFWSRLGDPLLDRLLPLAWSASTDLATAQAGLRQARAAREAADAGDAPQLGASLTAQHQRGAGKSSRTTALGMDASWEADLFGRHAANRAGADADLRTQSLALVQARRVVATELALAVIELRGLQRREALARDTVATRERTLALVRWRHEAGLSDTLALRQAQTAWAQAVAQIPPLQASIAQTRHALAVLCAWTPAALDARLGPDWDAPRDLPVWPDAIVREAPARVLEQRADVAQARSVWEARRARLGAARAARWPSLSLSGSLALQALSPAGLASGTLVRGLGASLSGSLLDGGAAQAEVASQEAQLAAAAAAWRATVIEALAEVEDRAVALSRRRELVAALTEAADQARAAAALATQRHESGLVDLATVLDTERTRLSAQDSLAIAQAQLAADHVSLIKALGGPWESTAR